MAKKKKGGDHGGGGHGWFVTFADLMGLLVAFFVMLVAFSTQDSKKLQIVAGSMREAFGVQNQIRYSGIIEVDGTFVGVVSELAGLAAGSSTYFVAPLDTALLRPGSHTVRLWTATRDNGTVTLRLVG